MTSEREKIIEDKIPTTNRCATHKDKMGYIQWHTWAEEQTKKGIKQTQCPVCYHWFFPEEM